MANRRQLYQYKGDRCSYCGLSVQEMIDRYGTFNRMFEFNHVDPRKKHADYENLIERILSSEQLDEVDKCILLCRECHGILHAQNVAGELLVRVNVGIKRAEQRLKGQLIIDKLDGRATFLTNERVLVHPYRVFLGGKKPRIHFGTELVNADLLVSYMHRIAKYRTIVVRSWNKREMMRAEYTGGDYFTLSHDVQFQLITAELCQDKGQPPVVWVRNGVGVAKDGGVIRAGTVNYTMTLPQPTA